MENIHDPYETVQNGNNQIVESANNNQLNNAGTIDSQLNSKPLSNENVWKPFALSMAATASRSVLPAAVLFVTWEIASDLGGNVLWEEKAGDYYRNARDSTTKWVKDGEAEHLKKGIIESLKQGGPVITKEEFSEHYRPYNNDYPDWMQPVVPPHQQSAQPVESALIWTGTDQENNTPIVEQPHQQSVQPVEQPNQTAQPSQQVEPLGTDQENNGPITVQRSSLVDEVEVNERNQSTHISSDTTGSKDWKRSTSRLEMFDQLNKRNGENSIERADRLDYGTQTRSKLNIAPRTPAQPANQTHMDEHRN